MKEKNYPGVFLRAKAAIVDSIIIILLLLLVTDIFSNFENVPDAAKIIAFVLIFGLYDPIMVSIFGSTVGHRFNNLKVQKLANGKKINFLQAIIRFIVKALLGWLSFLTVSSNENKQAIHDGIVKSVVVFDNIKE